MTNSQTILGIESSTNHFSVCITNSARQLAFAELVKPFAASEQCAEMVKRVLSEAKIPASQITHIAVNNGPGSFTGLRVAHSFAKGFAAFSDLPVIGIAAFDLIFAHSSANLAVIESKRDEIYFCRRGDGISLHPKAELNTLLGSEAVACDRLKDLPQHAPDATFEEITPSAANLCHMATRLIESGAELPPADVLYFHNFEAQKK